MVYSKKYYKSDIDLHYIFTNDDICFNFNDWENHTSNALFVTGLHGSGKSTLASQLVGEYECEYVTLDIFTKGNTLKMSWLKYYQPLTYKYFTEIDKIPSETDSFKLNENNIINQLFHFLKWLVFKNKDRVIIEGNELVKILAHKVSKNHDILKVPIIFKHTSLLQSIYQNIFKGFKEHTLYISISNIRLYYKNSFKEYKLALRRLLRANNYKYEIFIL